MFDFIADLSARQLASMLRESSWDRAQGQTRPHSDPQNQGAAYRNSFGLTSRIVLGRIVDYTSLAYAYKVQVDRGHSSVVAYAMTHTSTCLFGARELNLYVPGTVVFLMLNEQSRAGWILGAVPGYMADGRRGLLDQISQTTRARVDGSHRTPLKLNKKEGGIDNRIDGRPFDAVAGDAGWINSEGGKITIDDELVQLAVNEMCGVFGFAADDMLRLASYNLEAFGAGFERQHYNDVFEIREYQGFALYPYEQLGRFKTGDPRRELALKAFQIDEPHYANWEPKEDKQQAFHRSQEFRGYLGQGRRITQACPPKSEPEFLKYDDEQKLLGVHQDIVTAAGYRGIGAALGVSITKRLLNPIPHKMKKPEDGTGDKVENYKFSSQIGGGDTHKIAGLPRASGERAHLQRACGVLDLHAYLFNWAGLHPFHYHKKDWYTPQEDKLELQKGFELPKFAMLKTTTSLQPPDPRKIKVDDRYGEVDYWPNESNFDLLPDGGVLLSDGFGSEIRMTGGNLELSAPGDITLRAGRNVVTWGGWDAIVRAQNSVDISATKHDVRIAAQKHLHMLGGNDDTEGSVLIECRAKPNGTYDFSKCGEDVKSTGIAFRAADSAIALLGKDLYLRSDKGSIVLDADKGKAGNSLILIGGIVRTHASTEIVNALGENGSVTEVSQFTSLGTLLKGGLHVDGAVTATASLISGGSVFAAGGHILTTEAEDNMFVAPLKDQALDAILALLETQNTRLNNEVVELTRAAYQKSPQEAYYESKKLGADETLEQMEFSFRNEKQYLTEDWSMFEDRWQHLDRNGDGVAEFWTEKGVTTVNCGKTYPYPGEKNFTGSKLYEQNLKLYSVNQGQSNARPGPYEDAEFQSPTPTSLDGNYRIIKEAQD